MRTIMSSFFAKNLQVVDLPQDAIMRLQLGELSMSSYKLALPNCTRRFLCTQKASSAIASLNPREAKNKFLLACDSVKAPVGFLGS